jgi:hypothetical protein
MPTVGFGHRRWCCFLLCRIYTSSNPNSLSHFHICLSLSLFTLGGGSLSLLSPLSSLPLLLAAREGLGAVVRRGGATAPASWPAGPHAEVARRRGASTALRAGHRRPLWPRDARELATGRLRRLRCFAPSRSPSPSLAGTGMDIDLGLPALSFLDGGGPGGSGGSGASVTGSVVLPSDLRRSPSTKPPEAKGGGGMVDNRGPMTALALRARRERIRRPD